MEATTNTITNLSDDIRQIVANVFGEKLDLIRLCKEHKDPLLHQDKKPILNINRDEFVGVFDLNSNHYFLSREEVFRFGEYFSLALPNLIALILKAEWELYLSEMSGYSRVPGLDLKLILSDEYLIDRYISGYAPDTGKILNLIRNSHYCSNENITYSNVDFIIRDLLEGVNFLIQNKLINQLYSEKAITEKILLNKIPEKQRESYFRLKELWKVKSTELDDLLLFLERKKRLNLGIENKYLRTFGQFETEKSRFTYMVEKYKIIIYAMKEQPELSYRELVKLATAKLINVDREINDIKNKIARSLNDIGDIVTEGSASVATTEFRNSYLKACKKLLTTLYFLLHTDTCPCYSGLSQKKKTEINKLWLKLMKSTKEELYSYSSSMLLYSLPDYEQLEAIYKRACEILDIDPEDFELGNRLEFMIKKGTSIEKILEFLKSDTERLEIHLANLELVQNEYTNEDQSQLYRNALANIKDHSEQLNSEISELKKEIINLKKEISNGFHKRRTDYE